MEITDLRIAPNNNPIEITDLRIAPNNNQNKIIQLDDDTVVCKYISHFTKRENDGQDIFPGKPSDIKRVVSRNTLLYSYSQKFYTKNGVKLSVVRELSVNASIINKNDVYQLDIKYVDNLDKKNPGVVSSIIIKKQNVIDLLGKIFSK